MAKDYDLNKGDQLPEFWVKQIQEFIAALTPNLRITQISNTALRLAPGSDSQRAAGIGGQWRWITGNADFTHPAGAAGIYDIYVVASATDIVNTPEPLTDNTDYNFYMQILASGVTPSGNTPAGKAITAYRKIGETDWDGSKIVGFRQLTGATDTTLPIQPTSPNANSWAVRVRAAASQGSAVPIVRVENSTGGTVYFAVYTGKSSFNADVEVAGALTAGSLHVTGNTDLDGTLNVDGQTTLAAATGTTVTPASDSTTKLATTAFVHAAIAASDLSDALAAEIARAEAAESDEASARAAADTTRMALRVATIGNNDVPPWPDGTIIGFVPVSALSGEGWSLVGVITRAMVSGTSVFKVQTDHGSGTGVLSDVTGLTSITPATGRFQRAAATGGPIALSDLDTVAVVIVTQGTTKGIAVALEFERTHS